MSHSVENSLGLLHDYCEKSDHFHSFSLVKLIDQKETMRSLLGLVKGFSLQKTSKNFKNRNFLKTLRTVVLRRKFLRWRSMLTIRFVTAINETAAFWLNKAAEKSCKVPKKCQIETFWYPFYFCKHKKKLVKSPSGTHELLLLRPCHQD